MDNITVQDMLNLDQIVKADAWLIEKGLNRMVEAYEAQVRDEWLAFAGVLWQHQERKDRVALDDELKREAINRLTANRSTWSGGNSVKNMCEQVQREVATEWLNGLSRRITETCLNDAADKAHAEVFAKENKDA